MILTGRRIRNSKDLAGKGLSKGVPLAQIGKVFVRVLLRAADKSIESLKQGPGIIYPKLKAVVRKALLLTSPFITALVVVKGFLLKKSIWFQRCHTTQNAELKTPPAKISEIILENGALHSRSFYQSVWEGKA